MPHAPPPEPGLQQNGALLPDSPDVERPPCSTCDCTSWPRLLSVADLFARGRTPARPTPARTPRSTTAPAACGRSQADASEPSRVSSVIDASTGLPACSSRSVSGVPASSSDRVAGGERPRAARGLRDFAALRAGRDQSVVGPRVGTDAKTEYPGAEAADLEHVAGRGGERRARRRRAEAVGCVDREDSAAVEAA